MTPAEVNGSTVWGPVMTTHLVTTDKNDDILYKNRPMSLYDSLVKSSLIHKDSICLVDDSGNEYTFDDFLMLVERYSHILSDSYSVRKGTVIGLLLFNSVEYCALIYAANCLGAIVIPYPTKYRSKEVASLIKLYPPDFVIFDLKFRTWFSESDDANMKIQSICIDDFSKSSSKRMHPSVPISPVYDESLPALIIFTSGTTDKSKGVLLTNRNIIHAVLSYQNIFRLKETDKAILFIPNYNVTGLIAHICLFINAGATLYLHKFFDARRILSDIYDRHITFVHAAPVVYSMLYRLHEQYPALPSVRLMACGSGNMPVEKIKALKKWIPSMEFRTIYGLTETSSPGTILPFDASESEFIGSSGWPIPGMSIKIIHNDGSTAYRNEKGTILVKGTNVTSGYIINKKLQPTDNGWLDTGDIGYLNEQGYLYIVDRKKDMINRGGEKICSFDVENILYRIPGIQDAAVVGIPDELYGEVPVAMLVKDKNFSLSKQELKTYLKNYLASYQIPVDFYFIDHLPLTPNSKIDKKEIRKILTTQGGNK